MCRWAVAGGFGRQGRVFVASLLALALLATACSSATDSSAEPVDAVTSTTEAIADTVAAESTTSAVAASTTTTSSPLPPQR